MVVEAADRLLSYAVLLTGGTRIPAHTIVWAAGVTANSVVGSLELSRDQRLVQHDGLQGIDFGPDRLDHRTVVVDDEIEDRVEDVVFPKLQDSRA